MNKTRGPRLALAAPTGCPPARLQSWGLRGPWAAGSGPRPPGMMWACLPVRRPETEHSSTSTVSTLQILSGLCPRPQSINFNWAQELNTWSAGDMQNIHTQACPCPRAHMHTRAHACTRTHVHSRTWPHPQAHTHSGCKHIPQFSSTVTGLESPAGKDFCVQTPAWCEQTPLDEVHRSPCIHPGENHLWKVTVFARVSS